MNRAVHLPALTCMFGSAWTVLRPIGGDQRSQPSTEIPFDDLILKMMRTAAPGPMRLSAAYPHALSITAVPMPA